VGACTKTDKAFKSLLYGIALTLFSSLFERNMHYWVGFGWPETFVLQGPVDFCHRLGWSLAGTGGFATLYLPQLVVDILFWATIAFGFRFWLREKVKLQVPCPAPKKSL
jgi:hypothetical protein